MNAPDMLTPEDLRQWRQCPRRFWLHRQTDVVPAAQAPTPPDQALKASFPDHVLIAAPLTPAQWDQAVARTEELLSCGYLAGGMDEGRAIFGACLRSNDGAQVRIDVLAAGMHGLRLWRLKYATVGHDEDMDAVALWAHVANRCGLRLQSAGLLLIDADFVYPGHGCYAGLFREADLSPVLGSRNIPHDMVALRQCERGPEPPVPSEPECREDGHCEFMRHCGIEASPARSTSKASLDVVGRELAAMLRAEGHVDLHSVPEERMPDNRRLRALRAVQNDLAVLDARVAQMMDALPFPRHTIRFDTIGFAVPVWPGTRPYQVVPFQWSCDSQTREGQLIRQHFLAEGPADPRRAFAESLLQALGTQGAILAYNAGFERNRIRDLALCFEDLATDLECLLPRIVDLFQVARGHYYHPAMCGSWSFKSIARAVAPDLHVDAFAWQGIHAPQEVFAHLMQQPLDAASRASLRAALVDHGQRQTAALRRLADLFAHAGRRR